MSKGEEKGRKGIIPTSNPMRVLNCKRFGVLPGFLRTRPFADRTSGSGGNLALKDITMGLRWVRENIGAFGGDPTRITLMGHDTGAALVNLLLLAPYSKGRRRTMWLVLFLINLGVNLHLTNHFPFNL